MTAEAVTETPDILSNHGVVMVGDATVTTADAAGNGIIHVIDKVIFPPTMILRRGRNSEPATEDLDL